MYNYSLTRELIQTLANSSNSPADLDSAIQYLHQNRYDYIQFTAEVRVTLRAGWHTLFLAIPTGSSDRLLSLKVLHSEYALLRTDQGTALAMLDYDSSSFTPNNIDYFSSFAETRSQYADLAEGSVESLVQGGNAHPELSKLIVNFVLFASELETI